MQYYTIQQIAEMLETDPETVRRWIRQKKLNAVSLSSKKDGYSVEESELRKFLQAKPKYMTRFTQSAAAGIFSLGSMVGIPIALATLLGSKYVSYLSDKQNSELSASKEDFEKFLQDRIFELSSDIEEKEKELQKLEVEIRSERDKIIQLQYLINHSDTIIPSDKEPEQSDSSSK